jgi:hypothetical protein
MDFDSFRFELTKTWQRLNGAEDIPFPIELPMARDWLSRLKLAIPLFVITRQAIRDPVDSERPEVRLLSKNSKHRRSQLFGRVH